MKMKITTLFLTIATATLFGQSEEVAPQLPKIDLAKTSQPHSFGYLRMGISDSQFQKINSDVLPGLGVGYRLSSGTSAIDISSSFNRREFRSDEGKERSFHYTLPKVNYLYYLNQKGNTSLYAGGGLAWGGVEKRNTKNLSDESFLGLIPNLVLGVEMNRDGAWRNFIQLDVSQPAIAADQKGPLPKTFAEISLGSGF